MSQYEMLIMGGLTRAVCSDAQADQADQAEPVANRETVIAAARVEFTDPMISRLTTLAAFTNMKLAQAGLEQLTPSEAAC